MLRAARQPLAVHDHAARQDEATSELPSPQRLQQHRGAGVVGPDVVGDVGEVDAETDLGRLVAHGVDAVDRGGHPVGIHDVDRSEVDPGEVGRGSDEVEHPHLDAGGQELLADVRADETGATGDEDLHPPMIAAVDAAG